MRSHRELQAHTDLLPFGTIDKELRLVLEKRVYTFKTDTDTEVAAVLAKYLYDSHNGNQISFTSLIKSVIMQLVRHSGLNSCGAALL